MNPLLPSDAMTMWNYMLVGQAIRSADLLLVLGGHDDRVAECAAAIAENFNYWYVAVSGGVVARDNNSANQNQLTEAEHVAAVMKAHGYNKEIMLEKQATNTGETAINTFRMLQDTNMPMPLTIQVVTKPYMERRVLATFDVQWPDRDAKVFVTSPNLTFEQYCPTDEIRDEVVNAMVGDLQRIMVYPGLGFQSKQEVPVEVHAAYTRLIAAGYTKQLLKN